MSGPARWLTDHFALHEFARSERAARLGRPVEIPEAVVPALQYLCETVLEPLRARTRRAVFVLSGYRPPWLNRAVGGSARSQHMRGEAADVLVAGYSPREVCERIIALGVPFDQLILEFDQWTHVSAVRDRPPRGRVLTARKRQGVTVYMEGLT